MMLMLMQCKCKSAILTPRVLQLPPFTHHRTKSVEHVIASQPPSALMTPDVLETLSMTTMVEMAVAKPVMVNVVMVSA